MKETWAMHWYVEADGWFLDDVPDSLCAAAALLPYARRDVRSNESLFAVAPSVEAAQLLRSAFLAGLLDRDPANRLARMVLRRFAPLQLHLGGPGAPLVVHQAVAGHEDVLRSVPGFSAPDGDRLCKADALPAILRLAAEGVLEDNEGLLVRGGAACVHDRWADVDRLALGFTGLTHDLVRVADAVMASACGDAAPERCRH